MTRKSWRGPALLLALLVVGAVLLTLWKQAGLRAEAAAAASQPEPAEVITTVHAQTREHRPAMTAIGTVVALRSISLRNELAGTVRRVALTPGTVVQAGTVLVALDTSVEQAELAELKAQAALAETVAKRYALLHESGATSREAMDRAEAERAVTLARIGRVQAVIARKTLRAPFTARVGIADVHEGQFLEEGTLLTTLQGVDAASYVDFAVPQQVAAQLRADETVQLAATPVDAPVAARVVAIDSRVDSGTRNAMVRVRVDGAALLPGASVRVSLPTAAASPAVSLPASALRRDAQGDHVFVIADAGGQPRASLRRVRTRAVLGDEVLLDDGVKAGEEIAAGGSFKLREGALVTVSNAAAPASAAAAP